MNTLKFYPKSIRNQYIVNIRNAGIKSNPTKYHNAVFLFSIILTIIASTIFYIFNVKMYFAIVVFLLVHIFFYYKTSIKASDRIKNMEVIFPDVISLMASNLRSGITIDKAFILSARPEFYPLDEEILKTGKDITTGQDIIHALKNMSDRIQSEKISKVIMLITSGLRAGGNIADLLEQTSSNMKKKETLEKKSRSTILMYVIFIFFAVSVGAPVLFGLSSVLVQIVIGLSSRLPDLSSTQMNIPFSFGKVSITLNFVIYFSIAFIIVSDFISSLVIGLVRKGDAKAGLRYFLPIVGVSLTIFFIIRIFLSNTLMQAISVVQ
jgi:archaeal flagellar protein FlaJ